MIDTNKKDLNNKDKIFDKIDDSKSSELTNHQEDTSTDPYVIAGFLKLTDELRNDGIVTRFYFYDQINRFDIVLKLNEYYFSMKFVFSTGNGWDSLIDTARKQLVQKKIHFSHIGHILDTIIRNYELLENYQFEKWTEDSLYYYYEG